MAPQRDGIAEVGEAARVFRALAHESRRHVLMVLQARGGRASAGEIAARFSCSWPTTTRHLRLLEEARLVRVERQGRERHYVLESERLERVVGGWLAHFVPRAKRRGARATRRPGPGARRSGGRRPRGGA